MDLTMFKCPKCWLTFGVDKKVVGDDELAGRPKYDAELDVEEGQALVR